MSDMIRAFIAVPMPEIILDEVRRIQSRLRSKLPLSWVEPRTVHLTMKFLGDISPETVDRVATALSGAAAGTLPFELAAGDLGVFPDLRRPRILWLGLTGDISKLTVFRNDIENRLRDVQGLLKPEERPFKAHLTIGRIKARIDVDLLIRSIRQIGRTDTGGFSVNTVLLIQSRLTSSGPIYTPLRRICLGDAAR